MNVLESFPCNGYTIKVVIDDHPESPRDWSNLGTMQSLERFYGPDEYHDHLYGFWDLARRLAEDVVTFKTYDDIPNKHILRAINKHYVIFPYWRRQDESIFTDGQGLLDDDQSCDGVIFVKRKDLSRPGNSANCHVTEDQAIESLRAEIENYSLYASGEVYGYRICNAQGDCIEHCYGLFGLRYTVDEASAIAQGLPPGDQTEAA